MLLYNAQMLNVEPILHKRKVNQIILVTYNIFFQIDEYFTKWYTKLNVD